MVLTNTSRAAKLACDAHADLPVVAERAHGGLDRVADATERRVLELQLRRLLGRHRGVDRGLGIGGERPQHHAQGEDHRAGALHEQLRAPGHRDDRLRALGHR
jgi:hypothetical protein